MSFQYTRTYRGKIQLVIFDWAGTTVDFGCQAPVTAFVAGFSRQGVKVSMSAARAPMGMEKWEHIRTMTTFDEVSSEWQRVHGKDVEKKDIDTMYNAFSELLLESIAAKSTLLPDTLETISALQEQGIKIGASTGYFQEAADIVRKNALKEGYVPDLCVCASNVPAGRPAPWMIFKLMEGLDVYPPEAVLNVGDTTVDIASGLNAGVWSVGVAETGNQMGLTLEEISQLEPKDYTARLNTARNSLFSAGAHYVMNRLRELPPILETINTRLARGEKP